MIQPPRQTGGIKRMDHIEETDSPAHFVCLEVAHHMPVRSLASHFEYLSFGFLHSVFTKVCDAGGEGGFERFRRMSFANRNQSYLISRAIRPARGRFDPIANVRKPFRQSLKCQCLISHLRLLTLSDRLSCRHSRRRR
jgi:hypothetical protein